MNEIQSANLQFLSGGGEMGSLIRAMDWGKTALGDPETWRQSLRTTLGIMLNSKFPMFLFWGKELTCFYNDAYRPSLGNEGKHPVILGMTAEEGWPEIWLVIKPLIEQVMSKGETTWSEDQLIPIFRNGKIEDVYWTFSYSPVYNESDLIEGVLVTCSETTEKVKNFNSITESEDRFRTMAESADILIAVSDESGNAIYLNKAWTDLTGRPTKEFLKFGWADLLHPEDRDAVVALYMKSLESKESFVTEFRIMSIDENCYWLHAKVTPRFYDDGTFGGYICTCSDITEAKLAGDILIESEERFRKVANDAPVLIWMSGTDKRWYFFNSAWFEFTGRSTDQEEGKGWSEGVHPNDFEKCFEAYNTAFEKREEFYIEFRLKRHDGKFRWISERGVPRFGVNGTFEGYIGACMDIHDSVVAREKISENEERLNIVIEASELSMWEFNPQTKEVFMDEKYLEWLGYPKGTVITEHTKMIEHLHPDDLEIRNKSFKKAYRTGLLHNELRVVKLDGNILWMENKGKLFFDENKNPIKILGTSRNVTEKKLYEEEILKSEQKFRLLADSMPQHIWTADTDGKLDYYNESVYKYSGLTPEKLEEAGWLAIVHPDDRDENIKAWSNAISTGSDFIFEHRFRRYDGVYRWQLSRAIPQKDNQGNIQMWVGTSTDIEDQKMFANELERQVKHRIAELKELNETLAKSEERYHLMVEEVQDYAILYLNENGIVENWNKGAEKIKGYRADEIIGSSFSKFYTDGDRKSNLPEKLLQLARITGRAQQEGWRVRKDGSLFWASVTITAVHNATGAVIGFSKVTHDLTEKKETNEKLQANAGQLAQKNAELEKMNKELESFAYISSHDLQEPLRKIQTFSSRIQDMEYANLSENAKDNFRRMQSAAKRMQVLIEDLLVYSRTSDAERKYVKTDLRKMINEVVEDLAEEITPRNATIEIGLMGKADVIPFQFRQLMQNLLSNSLKFSKEDVPSHIKITAEYRPGSHFNVAKLVDGVEYCHINISDNGIGFDPEYSEKIFEVFQRLHGKNEYVGTGIGLAIVKKIVDNLEGVITATGAVNIGATFDIYFPVNAKKN